MPTGFDEAFRFIAQQQTEDGPSVFSSCPATFLWIATYPSTRSLPTLADSNNLLYGLLWLTLVGLAALLAIAFNRLVRHRNLVKEAWSGIDVQLKRRHHLIPSLLETVKGFAEFERDVLERVTRLRARATAGGPEIRELQDGENQLASKVQQLFAVAEGYPELRTNQSFLTFQQQLVEIEDKLQMARRSYNGAVRDHNIRIESVPSDVVAKVFGFTRREFFEVQSAAERLPTAVEAPSD